MSTAARNTASTILKFAVLLGLAITGCQSDDPVGPAAVADLPGQISVEVTPDDITAQWFLLRPDEIVEVGIGTATLKDMPTGQYSMVWGPEGGWLSPTPNPVQRQLTSAGQITFSSTYTAIQTQTGSIAIDSEPDEIDAPWTLNGPSGFMFAGRGDLVLTSREAGEYTLTWGAVLNYEPQAPSQGTLEPGGRLDFAGTYVYKAPPAAGTILINVTPDQSNGPWTITGPDNYSDQGSGDATLSSMPVGQYTVSFGNVSGWITPANDQQSGDLAADETLSFSGVYGLPGAPILRDVNGTPSDRATITLIGEGFGTHSLDYEWTGDWIESVPVGTNPDTKAGWNHVYSSQGIRDHITNNRAWSGSQSIDLSVDNSLNPRSWESTLSYLREPFESIYVSWWSYIEPLVHAPDGLAYTGLKHIYVTVKDGYVLQAATNSIMNVMSWDKTTLQPYTFHFENNTWIGCPDKPSAFGDVWEEAFGIGYPIQPTNYWRMRINGGTSTTANMDLYTPSLGSWSRQELYAYRGSGPDVPDGEVMWVVTKPGEGRFIGSHAGGVVLQTGRVDCRSEPADWQRFVFMMYYGDPTSQIGGDKSEILVDDVYLQFGTRARVEMGDRPNYDDCTQLEVQQANSWNPDLIEISVNYGGFSSGDEVYFFVVRDDDVVSAGSAVRLP